MKTLVRPTLVLFFVLTLITGVVYPALVTGAASLAFPERAAGSLVRRDGRIVGSSLIGQAFDEPGYVWGRPSATPTTAYNAAASSGSNLGPTNPALREAVVGRIAVQRGADPRHAERMPVDLVTASGSGLDPHVSPASARHQVARVAAARGVAEARVRAIVDAHVEGRFLGVLGEPTVNVLALNLALDEAFGRLP